MTEEEPRPLSPEGPKLTSLAIWFELDALLDKIDTLKVSILEFKRACKKFDEKIEKAQWPRFPVVTTSYFWADLSEVLEDPGKLDTKLAKLKEQFQRAYSEYRNFFSRYEELRRSLNNSREAHDQVKRELSSPDAEGGQAVV